MKLIRPMTIMLVFLCFMGFVACEKNVNVVSAKEETVETPTPKADIPYIENVNDFQAELMRGRSVLYVDDLSFENNTPILINNNVKIIGKKKKSRIERANFTVKGPNGLGEKIDVSFENIIFDGKEEKADYDFETEGCTFEEIFSSARTDKRCIEATDGYFYISLTGCEITGYASYSAPAIYVSNNEAYRGVGSERSVRLENCKFYENMCYEGTVVLASDIGNYTLNGCSFSRNTAKSASGMVLSNGQATVESCFICENDYYRFLDSDHPTDKRQGEGARKNKEYNYLHSCGALYIGGANATVKNCSVIGNRNVFGGGIGVSNAEADNKISFIDCVIADNKADLCGGAIYAQSHFGQSITFLNCSIYNNEAPQGGILYATTLVPDNNKYFGGLINFLFCTMAGNRDEDGCSFHFYNLLMNKVPRQVVLKGCFILDTCICETDTAHEVAYSYLATQEQAIVDGIVTEESLQMIDIDGLYPLSGSVADISVEAEIYSIWHENLLSETETKKAGATIFSIKPIQEELDSSQNPDLDDGFGNSLPEKTENPTVGGESESSTEPIENTPQFSYWILFPIGTGLVAFGALVFAFVRYRKTKKSWEEVLASKIELSEKTITVQAEKNIGEMTCEELMEIISTLFAEQKLTKKEVEISAQMVLCEKRKDISEKLFLSEDTVKTHISHIFKKVGVSSRADFRKLVESRIVYPKN